MMLSVTATAFPLVVWVATKALFRLSSRVANPLRPTGKGMSLRRVAISLVLEEIVPEDKSWNEVLGARGNLYMMAKKWDMAAAVASQPGKG